MNGPHLQDLDAEKVVIGCALMGAVASLDIGDFAGSFHRDAWRRIKQLESSDEPIDLLTVGEALKADEQWKLTDAINAVPSTYHVDYFSAKVRELAARRRLVTLVGSTVKEAHSPENSLEEILARLYSKTADLALMGQAEASTRINVDHVLDKHLEAQGSPRDTWGMRTGIGQIDIELGGAHLGETILLAGEPKSGKSMLAAQWGAQMAGLSFWDGQTVGNDPGAIFNMEMKNNAVVRRLACGLARVNGHQVMTGRLSEDEAIRFTNALDKIRRAPIWMSQRTDWTTTLLKIEVARLIRDEGIRWAVVDYAGLLKDDAPNQTEREMLISQELHNIAKLGVALIAVETLNKSGLRGDKGLGSVRGTVQKIYDADVLLFIEQPSKGPTDKRNVTVALAREADKNLVIPLRVVGAQKRFEPWTEAKTKAEQAAEGHREIPF